MAKATTYPKTTGESSKKYGACEMCRRDASEVFIAKIGTNYVFGHESCLQQMLQKRERAAA